MSDIYDNEFVNIIDKEKLIRDNDDILESMGYFYNDKNLEKKDTYQEECDHIEYMSLLYTILLDKYKEITPISSNLIRLNSPLGLLEQKSSLLSDDNRHICTWECCPKNHIENIKIRNPFNQFSKVILSSGNIYVCPITGIKHKCEKHACTYGIVSHGSESIICKISGKSLDVIRSSYDPKSRGFNRKQYEHERLQRDFSYTHSVVKQKNSLLCKKKSHMSDVHILPSNTNTNLKIISTNENGNIYSNGNSHYFVPSKKKIKSKKKRIIANKNKYMKVNGYKLSVSNKRSNDKKERKNKEIIASMINNHLSNRCDDIYMDKIASKEKQCYHDTVRIAKEKKARFREISWNEMKIENKSNVIRQQQIYRSCIFTFEDLLKAHVKNTLPIYNSIFSSFLAPKLSNDQKEYYLECIYNLWDIICSTPYAKKNIKKMSMASCCIALLYMLSQGFSTQININQFGMVIKNSDSQQNTTTTINENNNKSEIYTSSGYISWIPVHGDLSKYLVPRSYIKSSDIKEKNKSAILGKQYNNCNVYKSSSKKSKNEYNMSLMKGDKDIKKCYMSIFSENKDISVSELNEYTLHSKMDIKYTT